MLAVAAMVAMAANPAHAFFGGLINAASKLGAAGSKVGAGSSAVKGAAAGVAGVEAVEGANAVGAAARSSKAGSGVATVDDITNASGLTKPMTADEISHASGLGKAVPDEVARMMVYPEKKISDVGDKGVRSWLSVKVESLSPQDGVAIMRDYTRVLEGKAALGRDIKGVVTNATNATSAAKLNKPEAQVPWHAVELVARAAHLGDKVARDEMRRLCIEMRNQKNPPAACVKRV